MVSMHVPGTASVCVLVLCMSLLALCCPQHRHVVVRREACTSQSSLEPHRRVLWVSFSDLCKTLA